MLSIFDDQTENLQASVLLGHLYEIIRIKQQLGLTAYLAPLLIIFEPHAYEENLGSKNLRDALQGH